LALWSQLIAAGSVTRLGLKNPGAAAWRSRYLSGGSSGQRISDRPVLRRLLLVDWRRALALFIVTPRRCPMHRPFNRGAGRSADAVASRPRTFDVGDPLAAVRHAGVGRIVELKALDQCLDGGRTWLRAAGVDRLGRARGHTGVRRTRRHLACRGFLHVETIWLQPLVYFY
jgi:hypothetical protein